MNWKDYEEEIFEYFREEFPEATITHNNILPGRFSHINRQIDILIEDYVAGNRFIIIVDGKFFSENVDVKEIESFIGMINDVDAHKGLIITRKGYSKAAIQRAYNDPIDAELDILNFEDLHKYQGFVAIPYVGNFAVVIPAPFGWVIDNDVDKSVLCTLYQRGSNFDDAKKRLEFMYVNFWNKKKESITLDELIDSQNMSITNNYPNARISKISSSKRKDAIIKIREADIPDYGGIEIRGYVEFEDFIFFCVLLTPKELRNKNLRKLEYILAKIIPIQVNFDNTKVIKSALQKIKKLSDKDERAKLRLQISDWYYEMDDITNAIKTIEDIILEFPSHYMASKRLLILRKKVNNKKILKSELDRYFNLNPQNPTIYNDIIDVFHNDKKFLY